MASILAKVNVPVLPLSSSLSTPSPPPSLHLTLHLSLSLPLSRLLSFSLSPSLPPSLSPTFTPISPSLSISLSLSLSLSPHLSLYISISLYTPPPSLSPHPPLSDLGGYWWPPTYSKFQLAHIDSFSSTRFSVMENFLSNCGFFTYRSILNLYTTSRWILVASHLFQLDYFENFHVNTSFYTFRVILGI
jgi:hypothetical protein